MTDGARETRTVSVGGRMIVVQQMRDAQLILMGREAPVMSDPNMSEDRKLKAASRMLDMLESMVVQQADRDYLMDLNIKGDLEMSTLMGFISAFTNDEEEIPKPTVRRGRRPASK